MPSYTSQQKLELPFTKEFIKCTYKIKRAAPKCLLTKTNTMSRKSTWLVLTLFP